MWGLLEVHCTNNTVDRLFSVRSVDIIYPIRPIFYVFSFSFHPPRTAVIMFLYWWPGRIGTIVLRTVGLLRAQLEVKVLLVVPVLRVQRLVLRGRVPSLITKFNIKLIELTTKSKV